MEENKKEDWGVTCKHCGKEMESWRTYCPNCNEKLFGEIEENKKSDLIITLVVGGIFLIIALFIFVPGIIEDNKKSKMLKHESELLSQGKYVSDIQTVKEFADYIKNGDIDKAKTLLSKYCIIYDENNKKCSFEEYISKIDTSTYYQYEERGNSIDNEKTYRISWKEKTQIQTIILEKVINEDEMHYEITKCMITLNTI